jgi:hypothetical protein
MLRLVLMLLVLCMPLVPRCAGAQEQVGVAATVEGEAEVLHAGASTWSPLVQGAPVLLKDQLRTRVDAKIRVELRGDSVLQVAPSSQVEVTEQLLAPSGVSRFQLLFGTLRAIVVERYSELNGRFEVETPTAIAGVRGTSFIARYDPAAEETLVVGIERVTQVRASADAEGVGEVEVGPGMATRVRRGSRPLAPQVLPGSELRTLRDATQVGAGAGSSRPRANALDARRPQRVGERALSHEEQGVDQPLLTPPHPKPPPPPPPIPPRGGR